MFYMEYKHDMGGTLDHPTYYSKRGTLGADLPTPLRLACMATRIWKESSSGIELIKCRETEHRVVDLNEFILVKLSAEDLNVTT